MSETVLAALDSSLAAKPVLEVAGRLAVLAGAHVVALHVRDGPDRTAELMATVAQVPLRVRRGVAAEVIADELRSVEVIVGVLGARGTSGGARPAGSTVLGVIGRCRRPVVVVPPETRGFAEARALRVVLPLEGERAGDEAALPRWLRTDEVELLAIHVFDLGNVPSCWDGPQHAREAWTREFLARHGPGGAVALALSGGDRAAEILRYAHAARGDLLVLDWAGELRGDHASVLKQVIARAALPVLLLSRPRGLRAVERVQGRAGAECARACA
jgi:nucleotide-binding universal stress UspA family protein